MDSALEIHKMTIELPGFENTKPDLKLDDHPSRLSQILWKDMEDADI